MRDLLEQVHPPEDDREGDRLEDGERDDLGLQRGERDDHDDCTDDRGPAQCPIELPEQHTVREQQEGERQHGAVGGPLVRDRVDRERVGADREQADAETGDRRGHQTHGDPRAPGVRQHAGEADPQHPRRAGDDGSTRDESSVEREAGEVAHHAESAEVEMPPVRVGRGRRRDEDAPAEQQSGAQHPRESRHRAFPPGRRVFRSDLCGAHADHRYCQQSLSTHRSA
nr:hypothetical protein [Microbacterium sp.]